MVGLGEVGEIRAGGGEGMVEVGEGRVRYGRAGGG